MTGFHYFISPPCIRAHLPSTPTHKSSPPSLAPFPSLPMPTSSDPQSTSTTSHPTCPALRPTFHSPFPASCPAISELGICATPAAPPSSVASRNISIGTCSLDSVANHGEGN